MYDQEKSLSTRLIQTGEAEMAAKLASARSYPKVLPIYLSSVFSFEDVEALEAVYADPEAGYIYSRMGNPSQEQAAKIIAAAEGEGCEALVSSSGMAAIIISFLSQVQAGDHLIASPVLYGGVYDYLKNELPRFGVSIDFVDLNDPNLASYFKPNTKLVYTETITNPLMQVYNLPAIADLCHTKGATLIVDNTFATAAICQPLKLGADIVVYSATKYLCGHSDLTGGAIVASPALMPKLRRLNTLYGTMLSSFDSWLLTRSMRTLELRVAKHCANALELAKFFCTAPQVAKVHYPGLENTADYAIAQKLFHADRFGGMLSIDFADMATADRFIALCDHITLAPSLAGVATTLSYPKRTSHRAYSEEDLQTAGIAPGQIRISAGLEEASDLLEEFSKVLSQL